MGGCQTKYMINSNRPPRERELVSNQAKKVALVKNIFIAFLNELQTT